MYLIACKNVWEWNHVKQRQKEKSILSTVKSTVNNTTKTFHMQKLKIIYQIQLKVG